MNNNIICFGKNYTVNQKYLKYAKSYFFYYFEK